MYKAFANITSITVTGFSPGVAGVQAEVTYALFDSANNVVEYSPYASGNTFVWLEYSDNSQSIHEKIANDIRAKFAAGPTPITDIVVLFPDASGRF